MKTIFFAAVVSAVCATAHAGDPLAIKWDAKPLGDTQEYLESELQNQKSQREMNRITGALAEVADSKLMIAYLRLYSVVPSAEQAKLLSQQARWLKDRTYAVKEVYDSDAGGSIAAMEANTEFVKITDKRRVELEKRLAKAAKGAK